MRFGNYGNYSFILSGIESTPCLHGCEGLGEGREGGGKKEKLNLSRMESKVSKLHVHEERLGNIL